MNTAHVQTLLEYNYWADRRVLAAAAGLSAEQYVAAHPGLSFGSVRGSLVHVLMAEHTWRRRLQDGVSERSPITEADLPTLAALQQRWDAEEQAFRTFAAGLTDAALAADLHYTATNGTAYATPLWQVVTHVVNHGTQFRAEAAVALSALGHSPGDLDFIYYVRNIAKQ